MDLMLEPETALVALPALTPGFWLFLPFWLAAVFIYWLFPDDCCG